MRQRAVAWIGGLALYLVVSGVAVLMLLPFYWMVMTAFSPAPDIIAFPPKWIPSNVTFEHFQVAFEKAAWFRYYGNSAFVAVVSSAARCSSASSPGTPLRSTGSLSDLLLLAHPRDADGPRPGGPRSLSTCCCPRLGGWTRSSASWPPTSPAPSGSS